MLCLHLNLTPTMNLLQKRKLIDIVESHPDLWKLRRKAPNMKKQLWCKVGAQLNTTGCDAKRQWEILRDQFRREYKRTQLNKNYESKWVLYDRMLFTKNVLRILEGFTTRKPQNSEREELCSNEQTQQQTCNADSSDRPLAVDNCSLKSEILNSTPKIKVRQDLQEFSKGSTSQQANKQRLLADDGDGDGEPSTSAGVSSSSQCNQRRRKWWRNTMSVTESHEDEDYHFVMSILPSLRCVRHANKLRVRSKIMKLIAAELDEEDYEAKNHQQTSCNEGYNSDSEFDEKIMQLIPDENLQN